MTELLQVNVSSVIRGVIHEFGMAGAVNFHHLVKPADLVVGSVDPGQHRQYRTFGSCCTASSMNRSAAVLAACLASCSSSLRPMFLAAHSGRSFRALTCGGFACSTRGCPALPSAGW